jgi:cytochrome c-type biogenesis protein CcmH/NrfG
MAVAAVDRALAANPQSSNAWLAQAQVSAFIDPTERKPTLRSVRRALELDSTSVVAWHILALTLAEAGDFEGAESAWRPLDHPQSGIRRGTLIPGTTPLLAPPVR